MQIWKAYNKKLKRNEWRARFRFNNKQFRPKAPTKDKLDTLIREIQSQEKIERDNKQFNLKREVVVYIPTLEAVLNEALPKIQKHKQRVLAKRVFPDFLSLLPTQLKVTEIKTFHFQLYLNFRKSHLGKQTSQPLKLNTIYKEFYTVTGALKEASLVYESLENWQVPKLPKLPKGSKKRAKRERLVTDSELQTVIDELMKPPTGKQLHTRFHRVRLAHILEFGYLSGFRRKELAALKFSQYDSEQQALLNVKRWKTDTITKFFPLPKRAIEIIEERREVQDCDFIFSPDGLPVESNYRTLREICKNLSIPYGRFVDGGFVAHDLRHNFATELSQVTDLETVKSLTGHSGNEIFTYLHTNQQRQREAIRKREKVDYDNELRMIFEAIQSKKITEENFIEMVKNLFGFQSQRSKNGQD